VWRMDVSSTELIPIKVLVLVDAHIGKVVLHFNQIDTALYRKVYDHNNVVGKPLPGDPSDLKRSESQGPTGISDVDKAYDFAGDTYNFYKNYHNRDSLDNAGMQLVSTTRVCPDDPDAGCPYENAYWDGTQMVYGQGYASADDVVAHEMTHGVTQFESGLFYYMQSGAINEAFSDIWGEFVDLTNGKGNDSSNVRWLMGEDLSIGAIRSMSNPPSFYQPDRISSSYYYCGYEDMGGVHTNSGIANKAAYLMTDGGTFNGKTVTGLGIDKAAKIFYDAQTNLFTSAGDYQDLYNALQQACSNLVGTSGITTSDCLQVKNAVDATEMNLQPAQCPAPEVSLCDSGSAVDLFFDNLENPSSGRWTSSATQGGNHWYYPQNENNPYVEYGWNFTYGTSGQYNFWGDDYGDDVDPVDISDSNIRMTQSVTLPAGAFLHFRHAYSFETDINATYYDGGVIEYSINNGTSWTDAGSLITHNGYKGAITTTSGNPLGGSQAFVGKSNGYISTRLNLNSLAGQSIRFRFRIVTDEAMGDLGWFIDDIRIYTCGTCPTPGTPSNPNPSNTATGISINTILTWGATANTDSYDVYLGESSNPPLVTNVTGSSFSCSSLVTSLIAGRTYYWKIVAKKNCGTSTSGPVWSFTTAASCPTPGTPSNPNPFDGATNVSPNATLSWAATTNTDSYEVYFCSPLNVGYLCSLSGTTNTPSYSRSGGFSPNALHRWQVKAKNNCGNSTSGPMWTFTTGQCTMPGAPSNPTPSNGATGISLTPTLTWTSTNATSYNVYFGTTNNPPLIASNVSSPSYPQSNLVYGTIYYWKIEAKNSCGNLSGPVWSFTTIPPPCPTPGTPSTPHPLNNAGSISIHPTISIAPSPNAEYYDVYGGVFNNNLIYMGRTENNVYTVYDSLSYNTRYYWRVIARNSCGSASGPIWNFTTVSALCTLPGTSSKPSPVHRATGISASSVTLSWSASTNTNSYQIYLGVEPDPPLLGTTTTSTTYTVTNLKKNTRYYWKIESRRTCGNSNPSPIWYFTTGADPNCLTPGTPSNPTPANGGTGVSTSPTLGWTATSNTNSYDIYFGTTANPPLLANTPNPSYPRTNLQYNTTYYWKVVSKNNCGQSTSGPLWSFTTRREPIFDLVTKYYNDILDRPPEPGGAEWWTTEIKRVVSLGVDTNEGFIAVGKAFFNSAEYLLMNKTNAAYVIDLYETFLQRAPAQAEIGYWVGYLTQGMSRQIALNYFVYSPEFNAYMTGIFGVSAARPENNLVNDFYRGILGRLPDTGGFNGYLGLMRWAQCTGSQQVEDLSNQIALGFIQSAEYGLRARTNSQFIGDLYDAILRRGALPSEVSYWLTYLGTSTRTQVLQSFTDSPEFQLRVQEVIDAGCL